MKCQYINHVKSINLVGELPTSDGRYIPLKIACYQIHKIVEIDKGQYFCIQVIQLDNDISFCITLILVENGDRAFVDILVSTS